MSKDIHGETCGCGCYKSDNQKRKSIWNLAKWMDVEISQETGIIEFGDIWMDSRKLQKGDVFVALKGENQDGHDYVKSAFENGASAAIVEKKWYDENRNNYDNYNFLAVENTLLAIQKAAREYRRILGIPVVAITGSNGKTSTTNMLKELLGKGLKIGGTKGNFNNHIGVPLSILSLKGDEEAAIFEIGANHAGEIAGLTQIIEPDMGIITNIGYAHVGLFGSVEKTAEAKFELARAISMRDGILLLNGDDEMSVKQNEIDRVPAFYFGLGEGNQIRAENAACNENGCYSFEYNKNKYELSMPGIHAIYSVLPAIYLSLSLGINRQTVQKAVKELKPANMRGEIETILGRKIIADCYNANPSSMQTSLKMFNDIPAPAKRIAVLGTMGELGEYETKLHEELGKSLTNYKIDKLITVGKCAKTIADAALFAGLEKENIFIAEDSETAGKIALEISEQNDIVLFKGSRSVGLEKAIEILRKELE
jgi:UDP-N-acetylmuramoyl-tripeptide--D-alanyl-D-alanine ligase